MVCQVAVPQPRHSGAVVVCEQGQALRVAPGGETRLETSSPATAPCTIAGRGLEADPGVGGAGHSASLGWGARGRVAAASGRVVMRARWDGRKEPCEVYKWLNFSRREGKGLKSRRVPAEFPQRARHKASWPLLPGGAFDPQGCAERGGAGTRSFTVKGIRKERATASQPACCVSAVISGRGPIWGEE